MVKVCAVGVNVGVVYVGVAASAAGLICSNNDRAVVVGAVVGCVNEGGAPKSASGAGVGVIMFGPVGTGAAGHRGPLLLWCNRLSGHGCAELRCFAAAFEFRHHDASAAFMLSINRTFGGE